tara:strand:+ start:220 stop:633 length:414 start_codon:yes stop_codon:yes gene_type:complete
MADIVSVKKLSDSTREAVFAFQYQYVDTGDESAVLKIDVSTLAPNANGAPCTAVRIIEGWWVIKSMTVRILADADVDIILMNIGDDDIGYHDFSRFGGLPSTKSYGTNPTGDVKFTTDGAGAVGDSYQLVLRVIKEY